MRWFDRDLSARSRSSESATIVFSTAFGRGRLARTDGAELELVAGEGERARCGCGRWRRAAACGSASTPSASPPPRASLAGRAGDLRLDDVGRAVAEEDRDDRRRGLVGAEAVVVAGVAIVVRSRSACLSTARITAARRP
jgi:hypothetical protein